MVHERHTEGSNMTKRATMANAIIAFMLALTVLLLAGGGRSLRRR